MKGRGVIGGSAVGTLLFLFASMGSGQGDPAYEAWLRQDRADYEQYTAEVTAAYKRFYEEEVKAFQEFVRRAGAKWGENNVLLPERKIWVQYADDFEERSQVQFEEGVCRVQLLFPEGVDINNPDVRRDMAEAVQYLVLSGTEDPIQMTRRLMREGSPHGATVQPLQREGVGGAYEVQPGDTLWGVAKRFKVGRQALADANQIDPDAMLQVGQVLRIPGAFVEENRVSGSRRMPDSKSPLLLGQVQLPNGEKVTRATAVTFGRTVADGPVQEFPVEGRDGQKRKAVTVAFNLVPDHIRIRAERYRPYVTEYARRNDLIPALVYAIMHTESAFNPRARSGAPAYGLMQLVPRSGARDAYLSARGDDRLLDPDYLYDPRQNVELGTELLKILDRRYLKAVRDPFSRMYCSIAAYNTGAGNVCRAFTDGTSVGRAAPVINRLSSEQVYRKLCRDLPYQETRDYVRRVCERLPLYAGW